MIPSLHPNLHYSKHTLCWCTVQYKYKTSQWLKTKTAQKHANWFKNQLFSSQPETQFYYGQLISDMSFHQGRLLAYFYDLQWEEKDFDYYLSFSSGAFGELLPKRC